MTLCCRPMRNIIPAAAAAVILLTLFELNVDLYGRTNNNIHIHNKTKTNTSAGIVCPFTTTVDDWSSNVPVTDEFPYPLSCKRSELYNFLQKNKLIDCKNGEKKSFKVAIAYHIGMVKNWEVIVKDQINTLKQCGLLDIADGLMISYSNGNKSDLDQFLDPMIGGSDGNKIIATAKATNSPWEGPAMNMIHQYCTKQPLYQPTVVFYVHNKGASKWAPEWKEQMNANITWTYVHSLYWRKYLEYFLIERPAQCVEKILLQNASTCGANWHHTMKNHYSGNFWSASCTHIKRLKPMTSEDSGYTSAEFWLGKYEELWSNQEHHASLHFATKNLYEHVITPDEYIASNSSE